MEQLSMNGCLALTVHDVKPVHKPRPPTAPNMMVHAGIIFHLLQDGCRLYMPANKDRKALNLDSRNIQRYLYNEVSVSQIPVFLWSSSQETLVVHKLFGAMGCLRFLS